MKLFANGNQTHPIRFGPFEVNLKSGELYRDSELVSLPPQPFKVLVLLIEHAGELVTREEIQRQVWGTDTFVDFEKGLNFCIKQIRAALSDDAHSPQFIETLPRRGYRFIARIEALPAQSPLPLIEPPVKSPIGSYPEPEPEPVVGETLPIPHAGTVSTSSARQLTRRSIWALGLVFTLFLTPLLLWQHVHPGPTRLPPPRVMLAVLPFDNLNPDLTDEYFSDGLTEEMIAQLGQLHPDRLGVIARTTALTYKHSSKDIQQIGQELGVHYVLEGSVRRESNRVRITTQLIQVKDQTQLWSETYDRDEQDVLWMQADVAARVARSLEVELLPQNQPARGHSPHPEAYDAFLKGCYLVSKDTLPDFERSLGYFEQAIQKDPAFAAAYARLAETQVLIAIWRNTTSPELVAKAKMAAEKAVALDPMLPEALAALGAVNFWLEWNWPEAEKNITQALAFNPSDPAVHLLYASLLLTKEQIASARREIQQALALDPVSRLTNGIAAYCYLRAGQLDEAVTQSRRMLELEPDSAAGYSCLTSAYFFQGNYHMAQELWHKRLLQLGGNNTWLNQLHSDEPERGIADLHRAMLEQMMKRRRQGEPVPASSIASIHFNLGNQEQGIEWLEKAVASREPLVVFLKTHPTYARLRTDSRFQKLVHRLGLDLSQ
ncbi:MAG TPA: winged helix-turn-helix domain-containing protein [Acidobacteriota bacterium]|nr:winged helix-turn-helix domain-containing protein [Acidobacteriota bacterium]